MASLIESVRKLHGPHVVAHESGYDVDVICAECTRLRLEALDQAAGNGEDLSYSAESVRVPYPCATRTVAGTTEAEGREDASRMRLERLVVQREEIEEQAERLDAVIGLIRRDLGDDDDAPDDGTGGVPSDGDEEAESSPEPDEAEDEQQADDSEEEPADAPESEQPAPAKHGRKSKAKQPDVPEQKPDKTPAEGSDPDDEYDF